MSISRDFKGGTCGYITLYRKPFFKKMYGPKVFVEGDRIMYHAEFQEVAFTRFLYCSSPRFLPCPTFGHYCRKSPSRVDGFCDVRIVFHENSSVCLEIGDYVTVNLILRFLNRAL